VFIFPSSAAVVAIRSSSSGRRRTGYGCLQSDLSGLGSSGSAGTACGSSDSIGPCNTNDCQSTNGEMWGHIQCFMTTPQCASNWTRRSRFMIFVREIAMHHLEERFGDLQKFKLALLRFRAFLRLGHADSGLCF
jgi:hypothetical protein